MTSQTTRWSCDRRGIKLRWLQITTLYLSKYKYVLYSFIVICEALEIENTVLHTCSTKTNSRVLREISFPLHSILMTISLIQKRIFYISNLIRAHMANGLQIDKMNSKLWIHPQFPSSCQDSDKPEPVIYLS